MRRMLAMLMTLALLCALTPALARSEAYTIKPLQTEDSRVKLRAQPSRDAAVLGAYYNGAPVTVRSASGEWAQVSVGGRDGYMMREFLEKAGAGEAVGPLGRASYADTDGGVAVLERPEQDAACLTVLSVGAYARVLGTVGKEYLHVALTQADGTVLYGYASNLSVTQTDNLASAIVSGGGAREAVNLRLSPSRGGTVLGRLYTGVAVDRLFDYHTAGDGWDRVRVGNASGYIMESCLDYRSAGCFEYRAPMTELKADVDRTALYAHATGTQGKYTLGRYDPFCVLGVFGDRLLVRVEAWLTDAEYGYAYGFIAKTAVQGVPTESISAVGETKRETTLYALTRAGTLEAFATLPAGARVTIGYGAGANPGGQTFFPQYIYPETKYLYIDFEGTQDSGGMSGFVPADSVEYDERLNYPLTMTLG